MQGELGEILRNQRHHAGIVRARGDFAENHLVTADKQFHAKQPIAAQSQHRLAGNLLRPRQRQGAHLLRLPGLAIIAIFLTMTNRIAEMDAICGADGQEGDFEIKLYDAFDNHAAGTGAATLLGVVPGVVQRAAVADKALSFPGRTHHWLNDARVANLPDGLQEFIFITGKTVAGRRELKFFGRQATNAFTVHGQLCGFSAGHYALAFLLKCNERVGSNGFDFRHHEIGLFCGN